MTEREKLQALGLLQKLFAELIDATSAAQKSATYTQTPCGSLEATILSLFEETPLPLTVRDLQRFALFRDHVTLKPRSVSTVLFLLQKRGVIKFLGRNGVKANRWRLVRENSNEESSVSADVVAIDDGECLRTGSVRHGTSAA